MTNWRKLAADLAERLSYQAHNCPEGHNPLEPETCPFCADTAAYEAYLAAAGERPREQRGTLVPIQDIPRSDL